MCFQDDVTSFHEISDFAQQVYIDEIEVILDGVACSEWLSKSYDFAAGCAKYFLRQLIKESAR